MKQLRHYTLIGLQIIVGLILIALYLSQYKYTETLLIQHCDEKATRDLGRIQLTIERELGIVENAAELMADIDFDNGRSIPLDEETIYRKLEDFVKAAPQPITGAIIGFEDSVFPEYADQNGFLPLIRKTDKGLLRFQVGEIRDVRRINDWYVETKRSNRKRWSRPQFSEEGTEICCYAIPLHDKNGTFVGVLALDCSLERLSSQIRKIRSYPNAEPLIVDDGLNIVVSLNKEEILKETMFSLLEKRGLAIDPEVRDDVMHHRTGKKHMLQGNFQTPHEVYFYYTYVPQPGWTIQMTCPANEIRQGLQSLRQRMTIAGLLTFLIMLLVALTYFHRGLNKR